MKNTKKMFKGLLGIVFGIVLSLNSFSCQCDGANVNDFDTIRAMYFVCDGPFSVSWGNGGVKTWTGADNDLYYLAGSYTDDEDKWKVWNGEKIDIEQSDVSDGKYKLYFRGRNNTSITDYKVGADPVNTRGFVIESSGEDVECKGSIRYLLDYTKTLNNLKMSSSNDTAGGAYGGPFAYLFSKCETLVSAPELPFTKLTSGCYCSMFLDCIKLKTAPKLPATMLPRSCYASMFRGCESLEQVPEISSVVSAANSSCQEMFKESKPRFMESNQPVGDCKNEYKMPSSNPELDGSAFSDMLSYGGGSNETITPEPGETYYTDAMVI